jgi:hypothetical protein
MVHSWFYALHRRCIQGQGLGIVVWSLAKINYDASRVRHLLQAFAQEAVHRLNSAAHSSDASLKLGAQSLSNMLYAYALLNHHPGTQLLSAIAKGVQWQLRDFSPQVSTFQYNSPVSILQTSIVAHRCACAALHVDMQCGTRSLLTLTTRYRGCRTRCGAWPSWALS